MMTQDKQRTLLVCVYSMWGAVEWILPICHFLYHRYNNWKIIFLVLRSRKRLLFRNNLELLEMTDAVADGRCIDLGDLMPLWWQWISWPLDWISRQIWCRNFTKRLWAYWFGKGFKLFGSKLMHTWIIKNQPDLSVMDSLSIKSLVNALRIENIPIGYFPTATSFSHSPLLHCDSDFSEKLLRDHGYDHFDFYLTDTVWRSDFLKRFAPSRKIFNIGPPKLDSYWIKSSIFKQDQINKQQSANHIRNVLVLLKNEASIIFKHVNFSKTFEDVIMALSDINDIRVILKPHPRQDNHLLKNVLKRFSDMEIEISHKSAFSLIEESDTVIAMPSGVIINALVMGRIVIEYFNFKELNMFFTKTNTKPPLNIFGGLGVLTEEGRVTSIFRKLNFTFQADSPEELSSLMNRDLSIEQKDQYKRVRSYFPDEAAKLGAEKFEYFINTQFKK